MKGRIPRIRIEDYPAVKAHLDQFWDKIKDRADQGDTPYNLRNCAYLEEFSKPKIVYPNMTKYMPFVFDDCGLLTNQKCFIITGEHIAFLTAFLNSSIFKFCFRDSFPELQGGTRELSKIFFDSIPVLRIHASQDCIFEQAVHDIQDSFTLEKAQHIDALIYQVYGLDEKDINEIGYIEISK